MRGSGVIGSDWYLPLILPQWDAVGKGFWDMDVEEVPTEWGWLVLLSPAPRPDILAPEDSDTLGADTRTSSLTARRDLQAREAHSGQSRRPCWSSGVFGDTAAFPQMSHVCGLVMYVSGVEWLVLQEKEHVFWALRPHLVLLEADLTGKPSSVYSSSVASCSTLLGHLLLLPPGGLCRWTSAEASRESASILFMFLGLAKLTENSSFLFIGSGKRLRFLCFIRLGHLIIN